MSFGLEVLWNAGVLKIARGEEIVEMALARIGLGKLVQQGGFFLSYPHLAQSRVQMSMSSRKSKF